MIKTLLSWVELTLLVEYMLIAVVLLQERSQSTLKKASIHPSIYPSIHQSISSSTHQSISPSIHPSIYIYLSIHPSYTCKYVVCYVFDAAAYIRRVFNRMDTDDKDIVVLSGDHTVGRVHADRSGAAPRERSQSTLKRICWCVSMWFVMFYNVIIIIIIITKLKRITMSTSKKQLII